MIFLLVGIDTEGDNLWNGASCANQTFESIYALPKLHALLTNWKVRPTYLVTHPVVSDPRSADTLRAVREQGGCEVGALHHAWEIPPSEPGSARRHPYALALPPERFARQLSTLTTAIEGAVGSRPSSYRSGQFGFSAAHVSALERAGYLVESSVSPLFDETHSGGPDFVEAPLRPYFLSYDHPCRPGTSQLLELPMSAALHRRYPAWLERRYARAPWPYATKEILRMLGIARMCWLRPSDSSLEDMKRLAGQLVVDEVPILNLAFHSSEAIVGGSPYTRTERELEAFIDRLDRFLTFAISELGATPVTFAEFRARFLTA
jgi:hypothetical protein